jgi:4-diphosphocytidyl-2-C-methyl-D-erythritol kinase
MEQQPLSELLDCPAPAKLNLFLHVTGRRPDGYHLLQTAFRMLDWGDALSFSLRRDGLVLRRVCHSSELEGVPAEADLVVRAARLLQAECDTGLGVDIRVDKRLPMGGGLGGGSSDAATTLIALNRLWDLNLPRRRLQELGLALGADVPFFVFGESAFAEGVGEELAPLALPPAWYVVVSPQVMVPTAAIFAAQELTRNTPPIKIADFAASPDFVSTRNDLEPVARARFPAVGAALDWLRSYGQACMTGSGACVFAEVADEAVARAVVAACPPMWRAWWARGLNVHPLHDWLVT